MLIVTSGRSGLSASTIARLFTHRGRQVDAFDETVRPIADGSRILSPCCQSGRDPLLEILDPSTRSQPRILERIKVRASGLEEKLHL